MYIETFKVKSNTDCRGKAIIPPGVTTIDVAAFGGASGLTSVSIPLSVSSVLFRFDKLLTLTYFTYCGAVSTPLNMRVDQTNLCPTQSVDAGDGSVACSSGYFTVSSLEVTGSSDCAGSAQIPMGVTSISSSAFYGDEPLTSIVIPASVSSIGSNAFQQTSLAELTIPSAVTSIEA
jgi:hypothetical protein